MKNEYIAIYDTGIEKISLVTTQTNKRKALKEAYHTFREQGFEPTRKSIKLRKVI